MTTGLVKDRKTAFINGYAVQWFTNLLQRTKIFIYAPIPGNTYVFMAAISLNYIADSLTVERIAAEKIKEIERE